jgi:hypothetical protein
MRLQIMSVAQIIHFGEEPSLKSGINPWKNKLNFKLGGTSLPEVLPLDVAVL